jgi:ribosomal protein S18 acetylase RimI-like enzyme
MTATADDVVFLRLEPRHADTLADLFAVLAAEDAGRFFHPHALDGEAARRVAGHGGADLYLGAFAGDSLVGYGLLRGWDEGFAIPSLGLALHPAWRRRGLGRRFMGHLHALAAARGARRVRLTVHAENAGAIGLYRALGYRFDEPVQARCVGFLDLPA